MLKEERWRLESILKGTNVGSWEWNVQTGETVFNERWAEIIGYTLEEVSPLSIETWTRFVHPGDLKRSNALLQRHFNGELDYYEFESRMKHKNGSWIWVLDRGQVFSWSEDGKPLMMFGTHQDINERKQIEKQLQESEEKCQRLSKTDSLTGLLNRRGWEESIIQEEQRAKRYGNLSCVIILGLDDLKEVNDLQGCQAGDDQICRVAEIVQSSVRKEDIVARIGGDEFAILGLECNKQGGEVIVERLKNVLSKEKIHVSFRVAARDSSLGLSGAIAKADSPMYEIKRQERNQRVSI